MGTVLSFIYVLTLFIREGNIMTTLLLLYAGAIPLVPLIGAEIFKRREDIPRRNVCYVLFVLQLVLSISYVADYLNR